MGIILSQEDTSWINTQYPTLKIDLLKNEIEGDISFSRSYGDYIISDTYTIRISLKIIDGSMLPKVFEISNKIQKLAEKYNKRRIDFHVNDRDGSFCLSLYEKEHECFESGFTIPEFFEKCLEPFLFWLSYYDEVGMPPWGEYAHGILAYLEFYAEGNMGLNELIEKLTKKEIISALLCNRQSKCLCGSGEKLRSCHPLIFKAISRMKIELA